MQSINLRMEVIEVYHDPPTSTHARRHATERFSERTQEFYLRSARQLAQHYNKSPDQITEEELRKYFLYIKNVKKWKRATVTSALCGIKFFYPHTLKKQWTTFDLVHPQRERRLPVVLTREEIQRISNVLRNWYKTHRNPTLDLPCSRKTGQTR